MRALLIAALVFFCAAKVEAQDIGRIVIASGTRTNGAVRIVVRDHLRALRRCLRGRELHVVTLRLEIDPAGAVSAAHASPTELGRERIACIEAEATAWRFAPSDEATRARVQFGFLDGGMPVPGPRAVPLGTMRTPPPTVSGALSVDVVRRYVHRSANALRNCYELARQANPMLTGEATVTIVIGPEGTVTDVRVESTTFAANVEVPPCLRHRLLQLRFPAGDGETRAIQRFSFAPPP